MLAISCVKSFSSIIEKKNQDAAQSLTRSVCQKMSSMLCVVPEPTLSQSFHCCPFLSLYAALFPFFPIFSTTFIYFLWWLRSIFYIFFASSSSHSSLLTLFRCWLCSWSQLLWRPGHAGDRHRQQSTTTLSLASPRLIIVSEGNSIGNIADALQMIIKLF